MKTQKDKLKKENKGVNNNESGGKKLTQEEFKTTQLKFVITGADLTNILSSLDEVAKAIGLSDDQALFTLVNLKNKLVKQSDVQIDALEKKKDSEEEK